MEDLSKLETNPDLLFLGNNMPILNGLDMVKEIKKINRYFQKNSKNYQVIRSQKTDTNKQKPASALVKAGSNQHYLPIVSGDTHGFSITTAADQYSLLFILAAAQTRRACCRGGTSVMPTTATTAK